MGACSSPLGVRPSMWRRRDGGTPSRRHGVQQVGGARPVGAAAKRLARNVKGVCGVNQGNLFRAARELFDQGNHRQALVICRAALSREPDDVSTQLLLARSLLALRHDDEAQLELALVLRDHPRVGEAYELLAELAIRRDELYAAEIFLAEALRLGSGAHAADLFEVARALRRRGGNVSGRKRTQVAAPASAAARSPATSAPAGATFTSAAPARSHSRPLGELLVAAGAITRAQLFEALVVAEGARERIGDVVVRLGFSARPRVEHVAASRGQPSAQPRA
ncbi:MAG: tetratricopeptide repeat protein [Myxococcales bacterium]|nr:tetratricopeptide repeat protein [Myxococcales bacterium]